ncbi:MarR family winged helix-turn-helix transcriptional regulator [Desulfuromonas sp. DDH964]|uniref:MarR family winged helix-turn-helix transcriptional regulator n=1 Tax=Desulfuromonas sp. DDH964 TaxID=1823759 RepID=UPI00078BCFDB|nr:MarR family transcriptional regulator [Desulfuromonas sp. DDH964]AMV71074.1 MarR family winged helix-turn-helix transcriptional regulator [Desulfuromonas sp. DDH964]
MHKPASKINRDNLLFHLALLTRQWRQVLDTEIQASGLTGATWRPLLHLSRLGDGTRQKELAASLGIEGPSIVRILDTLLAKGLILRTEDVSDRRAKLLFLTPAGQLLVEQVQATVMSLEHELLGAFSDQEVSLLGKLVERLEFCVSAARRPGKQ